MLQCEEGKKGMVIKKEEGAENCPSGRIQPCFVLG